MRRVVLFGIYHFASGVLVGILLVLMLTIYLLGRMSPEQFQSVSVPAIVFYQDGFNTPFPSPTPRPQVTPWAPVDTGPYLRNQA